MQPESFAATIQSAFPTLPPAALDAAVAPLMGIDPLHRLLRTPSCDALCSRVAALVLDEPATPLRTALPGLALVKDEHFSSLDLPARVANVFEREGIETWAEVLDVSPADLLELRNLGERSMQQFLGHAVRVSAETLARAPLSPSSPSPPSAGPLQAEAASDLCHFIATQLRQFARWALYESDAASLGELLSTLPHTPLPPDLAGLWSDLCGRCLDSIVGNGGDHRPMHQLLEELLGSLDLRDRMILVRRITSADACTLIALADELGLTRERVRQLEARAREKVELALRGARFAPIRWRARTLRNLIGVAVPPAGDHFRQAATRVTRDLPEPARQEALDILLWLAGPYGRDNATGWLAAEPVPGPETAAAFCDGQWRVDVAGLTERLKQLGIVPAVQAVWMAEVAKLRSIEGHYFLWSGTVPDKAEIFLRLWGRPATADEIVDAIGEGHTVRATRSRLFEDSRFMRVDMDHVALREWGLPEYSGIAAQIGEEIDRRGGAANVEELVATLVRQFSLREQSVRTYLTAPMFLIERDTVRRRTDKDPFGVPPPVTATPACYLLGPETAAWRVEVNGELLRGSGRPMPAALAAWLALSPGERRLFACDDVGVTVSWPPTSACGPSLGSVRPALEKASCALGEQALLLFHREEGTLRLRRLDPAAVWNTLGLRRISLLTGVPLNADEPAFLHALGRAVGAAGTAASVRAALRDRGEDDLADLVPDEEASDELDAAINDLGGLL